MSSNLPHGAAALQPPPVGFHTYPHLPLDVTDDTMTTAGVRMGDLDFRFDTGMAHHKPTPVGQQRSASIGERAYPIFPTWGFVALEWSQAAALAKTAAQMMGVSARQARFLAGTHLVARLLHGSFPSEIFYNDDYKTFFWGGHVERVLDEGPDLDLPCVEQVLMERVEAADLARHIATTCGVTDTSSIPSTSKGLLLHLLLEAAAPRLLFGTTAHEQLTALHIHQNVLCAGRSALPNTLRADL